MAPPLRPRQITRAFEHWGVPFDPVPGWTRRTNGNGWHDAGVSGVMHHHTGTDHSDSKERRIVIDGHSALAGPLANFGVTDRGTIDIVSAGAANHAGGGDPRVLEAVMFENYDRRPPMTRFTHDEPGSVGGNGRFYGWETYFGSGDDPTINRRQYRVLVLSTAAIIAALDAVDGDVRWTSKSCIGHKEWQRGKPDPAGVDMRDDRDDLQWCLDNGPRAAARWFETGERVG